MADLIAEYSDYDSFVREWHANALDAENAPLEEARTQGLIDEDETRMVWQLLGELDAEELLVQIPDWLADEKAGFVDGATPTLFVGRTAGETEKAIRFTDSASARPLLKLAQRIHHLERGTENTGEVEEDRRKSLERRLEKRRREFDSREDIPGLQEEWLPKSQITRAVRRDD